MTANPAETVPPPPDPRAVAEAQARLAVARRVVVFTGAGVSAESGVPTFRGPGGLWREFRPEELATPAAFARDPQLVWEWYARRRDLVARCAPNAAHRALAHWAARLQAEGGSVAIVTQNVDGLHQRAAAEGKEVDGLAPAPVLALHGSLMGTRCSRCRWRAAEPDPDGTRVAGEPLDTSSREALPRCPHCSALLRPAVVWFGEPLDPTVLEAALAAAERAEVCLVVGTSALVHPAAGVAMAAEGGGAELIEVNPEATALSARAGVVLRAGAGEMVPRLLG